MLQLLDLTQNNIIATRANDVLAKNDYEKIQPLIYNIISARKKVKWYFEMEDCITKGLRTFLKDAATGLNSRDIHFTDVDGIEKIALVGTEKWVKYMYSIMKPFTKATIVYFDLFDKEKAVAWIMEASGGI